MIANPLRSFSIGLAALVMVSGPAAANSDPTGVWIDQAGRGAVEIAPCGSGGSLCGRVVWVKAANHQDRCGQQILGDLEKGGNGTLGSGWIFSPDRGRKFDVEIKRIGADQLRVIGWAGIRMFSETHIWKRAAADIARCGGEQIASAASVAEQSTTASAPETSPPAVAAATAGAAAAASDRTGKPAAVAQDPAPEKKRIARGDDSAGSSRLEKYFKRSADGTCKVDTPWVKVTFDCKRP